jgi:hypothetical protein
LGYGLRATEKRTEYVDELTANLRSTFIHAKHQGSDHRDYGTEDIQAMGIANVEKLIEIVCHGGDGLLDMAGDMLGSRS